MRSHDAQSGGPGQSETECCGILPPWGQRGAARSGPQEQEQEEEQPITSIRIARPDPEEYQPYHEHYLNLVPEGNILDILGAQLPETKTFFLGIGEEGSNRRYAPEKWSIKEILGHLCDTERIFTYRALRIGRGDATPLPGMDQDAYVRAADFGRRSLQDLVAELEAVRRASLAYFQSCSADDFLRKGTANDGPLSVRAAAYILAGHERHHVGVIRRLYLR